MAYFNYRKLLSERRFLRVQERARQLQRDGSDLRAIYYKEKELIFKTRSGTDRNIVWTQRLVLDSVTPEKVLECKSFKEVEELVKETHLKIDCNCLAEGTRILTKEGFKSIEDITNKDMVMGGNSQWIPVFRLLKSSEKKQWFKVHIRGEVNPLIVSGDHKVLVSTFRDLCACGCGKLMRPISNKTANAKARSLFESKLFLPKHSGRSIKDNFQRYQMKRIVDIKAGDLLCSPIIEGNTKFETDLARMLGYYLAEGHVPAAGTTTIFTLNQNEELTVSKDITDYFQSKNIKTKITFTQRGKQKWMNVHVYSIDFRDLCKTMCGQGSKTKFIHSSIYSWNKEAKESFLIGHLLGDGAVDKNYNFRFLSTSLDLIEGLKVLCNSIGIDALVSYANKTPKQRCSFVYQIGVSINTFIEVYNKYKHLFREKDQIESNNSRGKNSFDKYCLRTITSVEECEDHESYDIVLDKDPHTFTANGVIVSNCHAFHYWGYKYMAWKRGYGLVKETRKPRVRNRQQEGFLCKHLFLVVQLYPFWAKSLASKFRNKAEEAVGIREN